MSQLRSHVVGLVSLITVACGMGGLFAPDSDVTLALIIVGCDTIRIVAPDTVTRGVPFDFLQHVTQVRFATPGTAVLHVIGRASTGGRNEPAELLRLVTVR